MANPNQLIIEKVENGFIIAIQEKTKSQGFLSMGTTQVDKKYLVAKDEKEVQKIISDYLKNLITANESLKDLSKDDEDDTDED